MQGQNPLTIQLLMLGAIENGMCGEEITYHAKAKNCKMQKRSASPSLRHWRKREGAGGERSTQ